jgi:Skp family chaperone for outer membrane proteins
VIGVVDVPEIQRVSTAFNQVRQEIERRRAKLNEDVQNEQQRWRDEQQRLGNERGALSPEQLRNRERALQDQITDGQRIFRDRARDLEQLAQQALREIEQALAIVIRQVAASRSINLVLPRPLIIFNDPAFDMTEEVAVQLNRMISAVNLPPDPSAAPPPRPAATPAPAPAAPRRN